MSVLRGATVLALLAITVAGCDTTESSAPAPDPTAASGTSVASSPRLSTQDEQATPAVKMRAGSHGSEDRFVLEFAGVSGVEVVSHALNQEPPVRGGSGEPIAGMVGDTFLHVVVKGVPMTTAAPSNVVKHDLPIIKSAVVNDIEGGTLEATVGLSGSVDYEIAVEGDKVVVNMAGR